MGKLLIGGAIAVVGVVLLFRNRDAFAMPSGMSLSAAGLQALKEHEGWRPSVYLDTAGKQTIGYGHLIKPGEIFTTITPARGEQILQQDVAIAVAAVRKMVRVPITQNMFDALVSFAFNVGTDDDADTVAEGLGDSSLLKLLNDGNYTGAADGLLAWINAGGKPDKGLTNRRAAERAQFLQGLT